MHLNLQHQQIKHTMTKNKPFISLLLLFISLLPSYGQKVSCIGDSITWGLTVEARETNSYPQALATMLGKGWQVSNFGANGATAMRHTPDDTPYIKRDVYKAGLNSSPNIAVFMLGANDSKPSFWDPERYKEDFIKLINEFKALPSAPDIYLCTPVPSYTDKMGPWDVNEQNLITARVIVREIAQAVDAHLIDLAPELENRAFYSPDGVHPNAQGARKIATTIYQALTTKVSK